MRSSIELGDSRLSLDWVEHDPHGVREKLLGKTYYRTVWAKIANGLSAKVGNTLCPACDANFDYDQVDKKLKLLDCDRLGFPERSLFSVRCMTSNRGRSLLPERTAFRRAGSAQIARAEFDEQGLEMKLVGGPANFAGIGGAESVFR